MLLQFLRSIARPRRLLKAYSTMPNATTASIAKTTLNTRISTVLSSPDEDDDGGGDGGNGGDGGDRGIGDDCGNASCDLDITPGQVAQGDPEGWPSGQYWIYTFLWISNQTSKEDDQVQTWRGNNTAQIRIARSVLCTHIRYALSNRTYRCRIGGRHDG